MNKRLHIILLFLLCAVSLFLLCGCSSSEDTAMYGNARRLFDEGRYDEAQTAFAKVFEYENSAKYVNYISAIKLQESGDFEAAANSFLAMDGFMDSSERYIYCGARLLEKYGDTSGAITAYASLNGFLDSAERSEALAASGGSYETLKRLIAADGEEAALSELDSLIDKQGADKALAAADEAFLAGDGIFAEWLLENLKTRNVEGAESRLDDLRFASAKSLLEENSEDSIKSAREMLLGIGTHDGAAALLDECDYRLALIAKNAGRNAEAAAAFEKLSSYKDSAAQFSAFTSEYSAAASLLENKDFDGAKAKFIALGDFSDSAEMVKEADYRRALQLFSDGAVDEAVAVFSQLSGYEDSAEYVSGAYDMLAQSRAAAGDVLSGAEVYRLIGRNADADAFVVSHADALAASGDFLGASALYLAVPDYQGSLDKNLVLGKQMLQSGDYDAVAAILSPALDYADARETIYQKASECADADDFEGAKRLYALISGYNDSDDRLSAAVYKQAAKLLADGSYDEAAEAYSSLDGYLESEAFASEAIFRKAKSLLGDGKYTEAEAALSGIASYEGAVDMMNECEYRIAETLMNADNYSEAKDAFIAFGDYSDSADKAKQCDYLIAEALLSEGSIDAARERFISLGDYSDSAARVADCDFALASLLLESGEYEAARDAFTAITDSPKSAEMALECSYRIAAMLEDGADYSAAYDAFTALADYSDSAQWAENCAAKNAESALLSESLADAELWLGKAGNASGAEQTALLLADKYIEMGDIDKALEICAPRADSESVKAKIYAVAQNCENGGDTERARRAYELAGDYLDAKTKSAAYYEERYIAASEALNAGNYAQAAAIFSAMTDYKDSQALFELANKEASYSVGGMFTYGSYEQDNDKENGAEPISWIILRRDGENALVISEYLLDRLKYNNGYVIMTWEKCSLRRWLNDDFYKAAFTKAERAAIITTNVPNPKNPSFSIKGGSNTNDKIFCLNIQEIDEMMTTDESRKAKATPYAIAQGANADEESYAPWWLRSPGYSERYAARILMDGSVEREGYVVNYTTTSVRPVMWVNLSLVRGEQGE
ncbi:MAG: DUF6273 domain-containing protein [Eubacteriales bacterium]|nr:DUF6273 domain-containing protein [Eubacteriales bacterium]MDD3882141.1 DUF6273 domain-containing protein [Eubacteriales bacterium]MDD4513246.1 DUF6273 domain-containing protein [Eubacteriales bacterium]